MPHTTPSPSPCNLELFAIVLIFKIIAWIRLIPVLHPFLDISSHIINAVRAFAVFKPACRHKSAVCAERICLFNVKFIAPWEFPAVLAPCCLFPLSLKGVFCPSIRSMPLRHASQPLPQEYYLCL